MTKEYATLKNTVHKANNTQLLEAFELLELLLENEDYTTEEALVHTVLVTELENRGLIAFNANTWTYELVG